MKPVDLNEIVRSLEKMLHRIVRENLTIETQLAREELVRRLSTIVLNQYGYTVIEAVDGEEAVKKYAEKFRGIDLVILDSIMPKKSGREALEEMRGIRPDVKAIFMSGYTEDILASSGISDKRAAFLRKPVRPDELAQKIREVLDSRQA